jgi:hypothetical protein
VLLGPLSPFGFKELGRFRQRSIVDSEWEKCVERVEDLHPEESAELRATEEEILAGLQELQEHGGLELDQFIDELEQALTGAE